MKYPDYGLLPELDTSQWFNTSESLTLDALKGKVVVIYAFQMLCPGCVSHGLPLMRKLDAFYQNSELQVIGLHTVFEHHSAMEPVSLQAFLHEYRIRFPVAVDRPGSSGPVPTTMAAYSLQGTPSYLVLDRQGHLRLKHFGALDELQLGDLIAGLLAEPVVCEQSATDTDKPAVSVDDAQGELPVCDEHGCSI